MRIKKESGISLLEALVALNVLSLGASAICISHLRALQTTKSSNTKLEIPELREKECLAVSQNGLNLLECRSDNKNVYFTLEK